MGRYVALLRGINVGGKNLIKMADLKLCFEDMGFKDVATYIQSGNVIFTSKDSSSSKMNLKIEQALSAKFNYKASVVLRSQLQLNKVIKSAPKSFGMKPDKYRYDVLFLKEPLSSTQAFKLVPKKPGVDELQIGSGVLYFSRLISKASQSRLSKLVSLPIYQEITIRNWNTTTALKQLLEKPDS